MEKRDWVSVFKTNPYHDGDGKFTTKDKAVGYSKAIDDWLEESRQYKSFNRHQWINKDTAAFMKERGFSEEEHLEHQEILNGHSRDHTQEHSDKLIEEALNDPESRLHKWLNARMDLEELLIHAGTTEAQWRVERTREHERKELEYQIKHYGKPSHYSEEYDGPLDEWMAKQIEGAATPQDLMNLKVYRRGAADKSVLSTTKNPEGANTSILTSGTRIKPDHSWTIKQLQGMGFRPVAGLVSNYGYDGEDEALWLKPVVKKSEFAQVLKRNPYHDQQGQFTSKDKDADGKADTHIEGLRHVKGVGWTDADGKTLDADTAARMKALRVPPAWTNVRLSKDPSSSLQATGTDSKGRKQYLYSAAHSIAAAAEKFKRLSSFNEALSGIRSKLSDRMKASPDDTTAVLRMIQRTGVRVGSDNETGGKHKAYGATTLLGQHVRLEGDTVHLDFPGKHGQPNTRTFKDKLLADYIRQKNAGPEDRLFQTSDKKTRDVMKALTGTDDFSPKDFRTWHGTAQALKALRDMPEPTTEAERKKQRTEVAKRVSSFLNNTPAVALESYIDPAVFDRPRRVTKAEITEDQWLIEIMDEFCQTTHYDQDVRMAGEPEDD